LTEAGGKLARGAARPSIRKLRGNGPFLRRPGESLGRAENVAGSGSSFAIAARFHKNVFQFFPALEVKELASI